MDIPLPATTTSTAVAPTTTTTAFALPSGPALGFPSDLSSSSEPSHASTRNTSPDPVFATAFSPHTSPSPLVDLSVAATRTEKVPDTSFDQRPVSMDNRSFQSVNDRRTKLANERLTGNQTQLHHAQQQQQQQQQHQQQQRQPLASPQPQVAPRAGIQAHSHPGHHHRSLASSNWRTPMASASSQMMYMSLDAANTSRHLQHPSSSIDTTSSSTTPFPPHPRVVDQHQHQHQHRQPQQGVGVGAGVGATSHPNLGGPIFDVTQLEESFAYCYDRGNGQYTRLIPADMLPALRDIPALQQSCAGMVVVPQPRSLPPGGGPSSNTEPVALRSSPATSSSPADTIQIDNIVAATPPGPPPYHNIGAGAGAGASAGAGISSSPHGHGQRRPKIYCDKWVHEGVCAFTQQGCKYKHEMPADKLTQHQLGLFHGYPQWWRKHQADLSRQREVLPLPLPSSSSESPDSSRGGGGPLGGVGLGLGFGLGLASSKWRQSGEYHAAAESQTQTQTQTQTQALGHAAASSAVASAIGRTRGASGALRTPISASSPDITNLSPCPASSGSPFGPIAPPVRSHGISNSPGSNNARPISLPLSLQQSSMESHQGREEDGLRLPLRAARTRTTMPMMASASSGSMLPASNNPYASLDMFDDGEDQNQNQSQNTGEGKPYTGPRSAPMRLP
ncbi:hypothetical protein F5Y14DRAFT_462350 [Nemania sp. NC0429]|nr:hypothetical protein F5Y14DRAFT_462350 [Nemania sp. NC0429]